MALERWEEAVTAFCKAAQLEPENGEAHRLLGLALAMLERWEEAVAPLCEATRLEPENAEAHRLLDLARRGGAE